MRGKDYMERSEGERLHAQGRRRFWMILGGICLLGVLVGMVAGYARTTGASLNEYPGWVGPLGIAGIVVASALFAYGSWRFFVSIDEVELADNLWGSLIGFYTYAMLFPAWWALWKLQQMSEPNDWAIFATALIVTLAVYAWRKWQQR